MAIMALIFSGLASIPRLLTMNPSSFPEGTPKTLGWVEFPSKLSGVSDELILGLRFNDDIVNIGFNIAM